MSSFVIFWLIPPSPSGDDVIYEQPLTSVFVTPVKWDIAYCVGLGWYSQIQLGVYPTN